MRTFLCALCCGCASLVGSSCLAATVQPLQGTLSINQGQGFAPVNGRADASVGDSVMVGPGGYATLVYDDGCKVDIQPGAVATVAPLSPCASGSYAQDYNNNNLWGAAIIGTAAAGALGVTIYEMNKSTNSTAASP
jgi:hypothetical protein